MESNQLRDSLCILTLAEAIQIRSALLTFTAAAQQLTCLYKVTICQSLRTRLPQTLSFVKKN